MPRCPIHEIEQMVEYDPVTGYMRTLGQYGSEGTLKGNLRMIRLPTSLDAMDRGGRQTEYVRADHVAWTLATGEWPTGWIEHVGPMLDNQQIEDLIHLDPEGNRWWYGSPKEGKEASLYMVKAYETPTDGAPLTGPRTRVIVDRDGRHKVVPELEVGVQKFETEINTVIEDPRDFVPYERGEFGKDWGLDAVTPKGKR